MLSASNTDHHVADLGYYEHLLDEDIHSVDCWCDGGSDQPLVAAIGGADCPSIPDGGCAVVYSKEICGGMMQEISSGTSDKLVI